MRSRPTRAWLLLLLPVVVAVAAIPLSSASAAGPEPPPVAPAARFTWPLAPPHTVLRVFDRPPAPWAAGHRGVDLTASVGAAVLAAGNGVVAYAGFLVDRPVISVDHPGGLRTTYEPVDPVVARGQQVHRGEVIGHLLAGHPGCPTSACLHWGLRRGTEYLNPVALLSHRVRLLPFTAPP